MNKINPQFENGEVVVIQIEGHSKRRRRFKDELIRVPAE
jgi:hypothetical protein